MESNNCINVVKRKIRVSSSTQQKNSFVLVAKGMHKATTSLGTQVNITNTS
jgi:hypothetical protein